MSDALLTDEQKDIINFFPQLAKNPNMLVGVKSFAGCGKSFVLKQASKQHSSIRMLGLAFNNSIASENKHSFPKRNVKWFTVHGFAKEYLKKFNAPIDFGEVISDLKPIELFDILDIKDSSNYTLARAISECMKIFCQSDLKMEEFVSHKIREAGIKQLNPLILDFGPALLEASTSYAKQLWDLHEKGVVPPTFNFYLKYFEVYGYAKKIDEFDILMIDEAQDSNFVTYSIAKQLPCAIIAVGDEHQSIYGFRGTLNLLSMAQKSFYLSVTFRYIPKIADMASKVLAAWKGEKVPIKSRAKNLSAIDGKMAILSRNNSTMIAVIEQLIKNDKIFTTVKKPEELFGPSLALLEFRLEGKTTSKAFEYINKFSTIEEIEDYILESDDNELKTAFAMQRRYGKRLFVFLKIAKENFQKHKKDSQIILSTAHTSKGLEWDHVELLSDFPNIQRLLEMAKIKNPAVELAKRMEEGDATAFSIAQEINLFYVAITRARFGVTKRTIEVDDTDS